MSVARTPYTYARGKDPQFDAYMAKWNNSYHNAWADAGLKEQQAKIAYQQALSRLAQQAVTGRQNLATSLLQRGVYSSGEAMQDRAKLEAANIAAQNQARTNLANSNGAAANALQHQIGNMNLDWESNLSAALARLRKPAAGTGGGGGLSGATSTPVAPGVKPPAVAPVPTVTPPKPYTATPRYPGGGGGGGGMRVT